MRFGLIATLGLGLTVSALVVACASEDDPVDVYTPGSGGADAGKGGAAGTGGKSSSGGAGGSTSSGGAAGQAGQPSSGGAAGANGGAAGEPSSGGAAGDGGAAGANGGAAGDGGAAGANGGAAGDGGAAGATGGSAGSPGTGGSGGAVDCWSIGYSGNCNPVKNDCTGGLACDLIEDWEGYLVLECVSDGPQKTGESCDDENGPYCGAGMHCDPIVSVCKKYCCSDADCTGVGGSCKAIDSLAAELGLCE